MSPAPRPVRFDRPPRLPGPVAATLGRPWWRETRVARERSVLRSSAVWETGVPPGRSRHALLVPGYLADGSSMVLIADWLARSGWTVRRASVGRNAGASAPAAAAVERDLEALAREAGTAGVAVIGHSRGGQQARVVAARRPELVDTLITLGSPVRCHRPPFLPIRLGVDLARGAARLGLGPRFDRAAEARFEHDLLRRDLNDRGVNGRDFNGRDVNGWDRNGRDRNGRDRNGWEHAGAAGSSGASGAAGPWRWTSIWSRHDGIVDWQACVDLRAHNVEVHSTHFGLAGSVPAFAAIAGALASG